MRHPSFVLLLISLFLASCGAATAHAANGGSTPSGKPTSSGNIACSIRFNGIGLDFVKFHLSCMLHDADARDTSYSLTGLAQPLRGTLPPFRWCQGALLHGAATCQSDFVIIVPMHAPSVTITAHFLPSNRTVQTQAAIPQA